MSPLSGMSADAPQAFEPAAAGLNPDPDVSHDHVPPFGRQTARSTCPSASKSLTVSTAGMKNGTSAESALEPLAFEADTTKKYDWPRVNPETPTVVAGTDATVVFAAPAVRLNFRL